MKELAIARSYKGQIFYNMSSKLVYSTFAVFLSSYTCSRLAFTSMSSKLGSESGYALVPIWLAIRSLCTDHGPNSYAATAALSVSDL